MIPIILEWVRPGVGLALLLLAVAVAITPPLPPPLAAVLGSQPLPVGSPPMGDALVSALRGADEDRAMMAVYRACALPPAEALSVAERVVATPSGRQARALARVVRDCALPPSLAMAELEALLLAGDPGLAAVAVLELHRLGARGHPALERQATRGEGLAAWLAAYSVERR